MFWLCRAVSTMGRDPLIPCSEEEVIKNADP